MSGEAIKVPPTPGPRAVLCYLTPPPDGSKGNPMQHCDRKHGHRGRHSWELEAPPPDVDRVGTIGESWASYVAHVIPPNAPEVQREECKRAFYAGAQGMYFALLLATDADDDDAIEARLDSLAREMEDWLRLFKRREGLT